MYKKLNLFNFFEIADYCAVCSEIKSNLNYAIKPGIYNGHITIIPPMVFFNNVNMECSYECTEYNSMSVNNLLKSMVV